MRRCAAKTSRGTQCLNSATQGRYCTSHKGKESLEDGLAMGLGALAAAAIAPGFLPALAGSIAGKAIRRLSQINEFGKKRVFVSFDFDNDRELKHLIIGQTRHPDLAFEVVDHSLKEAAPEKDWEKKARAAIARADVVLVLVGRRTHTAHGVLKEVRMARELGVKVVQIVGYRTGSYTPVPGAGRLYRWSRDNLKTLLT